MNREDKRFRRWFWWKVCYFEKGQWLYWKWGHKTVRNRKGNGRG